MEITSILKLISLLVAAGFAILGTTVDYKKEGQVTRWGRIAIIGVIVSGLLSSILLGMEESNKVSAQKKADAAKAIAEEKANEEKAQLNDQFQNLVSKAQDNIGKTEETLGKTNEVAQDVQQSVTDQKNLMAQTRNISGGVDKSVAQQGNILNQMEGQVALQQKTFDQTQELQTQQGNILNQMQGQVALQQKTFDQTQELQKQQAVVLQNTMRSLNSFKQFKLKYVIIFPLETPELQHYLNDLKNYALFNKDNPKLRENEKMKVIVVKNEVVTADVFMDSPYFSRLKKTEPYHISSFLTGSYLSLKFAKKYDGTGLIINTAAPGSAQELEEAMNKSLFDRPVVIQSFRSEVVFFNLAASRMIQKAPGIYLHVETNLILSWGTDETRSIQSFFDLPESTMTVEGFPCGGKFQSFEFQTGDGYGTRYAFPKQPSDFQYQKVSYRECTASYSFKKSDFGFF